MKRHTRQEIRYQRERYIRKRFNLLRAIDRNWGWDWPWYSMRWRSRMARHKGQLADDLHYYWSVPQCYRQMIERPHRHWANQLVRMGRYDDVPRRRKDAKRLYW